MAAESAIAVTGLGRDYGRVRAVDAIDLDSILDQHVRPIVRASAESSTREVKAERDATTGRITFPVEPGQDYEVLGAAEREQTR